ncbi:MAG: YHS domain-containing protein [Candidatus Omnitrophica bacterium]|nr:YHS domain-containing protein [Candidatus Omnitrophota bacterium]
MGDDVSPEAARDPVCQMPVDPALYAFSAVHQGQTYQFCSLTCQQLFEEDPERYLPRQQGGTPR